MNRYIIGSLWDRVNRNGVNKNFEYLFEGSKRVESLNNRADNILNEAERVNKENISTQKQVDDLILHAGESDAEVIQARGQHPLLKDRLDDVNDNIDLVNHNLKSRGVNIYDYKHLVVNDNWDLAVKTAINDLPHNGKLIVPEVIKVNQVVAKSNITIAGLGGFIRDEAEVYNRPIVSLRDVENVLIEDISINALDLIVPYNQYTAVTQRSTLDIRGASNNIKIKNVTLENAGRDGIYVGESASGNGEYPKNLSLDDVVVKSATRNCISIVCAENINISNPVISNYGLCGIDIEPNLNTTITSNIKVRGGEIRASEISTSGALQCTLGSAPANVNKFKDVLFEGVSIIHNGNPDASAVRNSGFDNVLIKDLKIEKYVTGILASENTDIINNNLFNPAISDFSGTSGGIILTGNGKVSLNSINGVSSHGIVTRSVGGTIVTDNFIENIGLSDKELQYGIFMDRSPNNIVSRNKIVDLKNSPTTSRGIYLRDSVDDGLHNIVNMNIFIGNVTGTVFSLGTNEQLNTLNNYHIEGN